MAKAKVNIAFMKTIFASMQDQGFHYVTEQEAAPLTSHNPQLLMVNPNMADPNDPNKRAAKLTDEGIAMINKPSTQTGEASAASPYAVMSGIELPKSKRGAASGGAPTVYPFDTMQVNDFFFVPVSAKHKDPVKQLGSTVSAANARYSEETGETKTVERTKRGEGNKAVLDAAGNKVKETVQVKVKRPTRKFVIRPVEAGKSYGSWTAPENGAVVSRVALD